VINKTNTYNNQTLAFEANPAQIYKAIKNGARTCPHAMDNTKQLAGAVEELGKSHGLKIDIPLRGSNVREKTLAQLPQGISDTVRKAVDDVVNMVTSPFRHCKDGCNKDGLTRGEVTSNVLVNWGAFKNHDIGNPFTLSTRKKFPTSLRELLGYTKKPITNDEQRAGLFRRYLDKARINPDEVSFPSVRRILSQNS